MLGQISRNRSAAQRGADPDPIRDVQVGGSKVGRQAVMASMCVHKVSHWEVPVSTPPSATAPS
jgi:hypothetical protein